MVSQNTVLILGAGASRDYGYPTGEELAKKIADPSKWNDFEGKFVKYWTNADERINEYVTGFDVIKYHFGKSRSLSIDAWLAKEGNRKYLAAGKILIAYFIANHELTYENLFEMDKDWYRQLLNKLTTPNKLDDFGSVNSKLSIITFNYDRSLEYYLLTSMQSTYVDRSEQDCWNQLKSIPIIHVYGHVGELPIEDRKNGVAYGERSLDMYPRRTEGLQIIPDVRDEANETIEIIQNKIREAVHIYFIGFSYDKSNLAILGFPLDRSHFPSNIRGSAFGLERGEIEMAQRNTQVHKINSTIDPRALEVENADAYTFFRRVVAKAFA